ncbi:MAG: HEPN domain-containing protein [Nanoarchaeota archaeon]
MRKEIMNWWEQAKSDFKKAEILYKSESYDGVAFYCQQTAEKALKAVILLKTKEKTEGHSLIYLGQRAKVPDNFYPQLKRLSPQYFLSRYPDASEDVPYSLYERSSADDFIDITKKVLEWTKKQLE